MIRMNLDPSEAPTPTDADDQARAQLTEFQKFIMRVWESGAGGKIGLTFLYLAFALPFIFNVVVLVVVGAWIWPIASGVTEKLAVLGFLALVLNAVAYQVRSAANNAVTVMFLTRRRRRRKAQVAKGEPSTEGETGSR